MKPNSYMTFYQYRAMPGELGMQSDAVHARLPRLVQLGAMVFLV